jgi:hypothetical protein
MRRLVPFVIFAFTALPAAAEMLDVSGVGSATRDGSAASIGSDSGESAWEMLSRLLFGSEEEDRLAAGAVELIGSFSDTHGVACREHVRQVRLGNELVEASGTVCREADGSWSLKK